MALSDIQSVICILKAPCCTNWGLKEVLITICTLFNVESNSCEKLNQKKIPVCGKVKCLILDMFAFCVVQLFD